jgi:hypothetical protein
MNRSHGQRGLPRAEGNDPGYPYVGYEQVQQELQLAYLQEFYTVSLAIRYPVLMSLSPT